MERISKEDLELLHGKMIAEKNLLFLVSRISLSSKFMTASLIAQIIEVVSIA